MPTKNHKIAGTVRYEATGNGGVRWLDNYEANNIATVFIPELKGVPTYGGKFSGNVRFYKRAIPQLKAAFAELGRRGLTGDIIFWDGSYVPRMQRGSSTAISEHSFGCAFDVNADWNPFHRPAAASGAKGSLHRVAPILKKYGFDWGNDWIHSKDAMHFEVNRILSADEIARIAADTPSAAPSKVPVKTPRLILAVARDGSTAPEYDHLETARLENGSFEVDRSEVLAAVFGAKGRADIRSVLEAFHVPYSTPANANHLNDEADPRQYVFVDTRAPKPEMAKAAK